MNRTVLFFTIVISMIFGCSGENSEQSKINREDLKTNEALQFFIRENPGKEVIKYEVKDLNNDGQEDLLILYKISKEKNMMCVLLNLGKSYVATNEVPAPVSNQVIHFKDIDDKPPMEFIVQGMKGAKIGYAIFRIEKGQIVDLFGEGMEDCC